MSDPGVERAPAAGARRAVEPPQAERAYREALALMASAGASPNPAIIRGFATHNLAIAVMQQGRLGEAEALFREALALAEAGGDSAASRALTASFLGNVLRDQHRLAEAGGKDRPATAPRGGGC